MGTDPQRTALFTERSLKNFRNVRLMNDSLPFPMSSSEYKPPPNNKLRNKKLRRVKIRRNFIPLPIIYEEEPIIYEEEHRVKIPENVPVQVIPEYSRSSRKIVPVHVKNENTRVTMDADEIVTYRNENAGCICMCRFCASVICGCAVVFIFVILATYLQK